MVVGDVFGFFQLERSLLVAGTLPAEVPNGELFIGFRDMRLTSFGFFWTGRRGGAIREELSFADALNAEAAFGKAVFAATRICAVSGAVGVARKIAVVGVCNV